MFLHVRQHTHQRRKGAWDGLVDNCRKNDFYSRYHDIFEVVNLSSNWIGKIFAFATRLGHRSRPPPARARARVSVRYLMRGRESGAYRDELTDLLGDRLSLVYTATDRRPDLDELTGSLPP